MARPGSLAPEPILGIETGGYPHTAIRKDASISIAGMEALCKQFPILELRLIESGG